MFGLSGVRCHVCGMAIENTKYARDSRGNSLYWADPNLSQFTDAKLDFCGVQHSAAWHIEQIEARKNVTQDT